MVAPSVRSSQPGADMVADAQGTGADDGEEAGVHRAEVARLAVKMVDLLAVARRVNQPGPDDDHVIVLSHGVTIAPWLALGIPTSGLKVMIQPRFHEGRRSSA